MAKVKVRLLTGMAGAEVKNRGDVHECGEREAQRLIDAGFAEAIATGRAPRETATRKAPESREAGAPAPKGRRSVVKAVSDAIVEAVRGKVDAEPAKTEE